MKKSARVLKLKYFLYDFVKWTGAISALIYLRPKIKYESKKAKKLLRGGAVLIANHESFIDPIKVHFAFWYRRIHIVATSELYSSKLKRWFFTKMLCIEVNKEHFNFQTFRNVSETLSNKGVVALFPEGGLKSNEDGNVSPFKAGAVIMAMENHVPIVPIYLNKPKKWYNRQIIVIGEPVTIEDNGNRLPLAEVENITKKIYKKELELIKSV